MRIVPPQVTGVATGGVGFFFGRKLPKLPSQETLGAGALFSRWPVQAVSARSVITVAMRIFRLIRAAKRARGEVP